MNIELNDIFGVLFLRSFARLLRLGLGLFELLFVDGKTKLLSHQASQVDGKAVSVIQSPYVLAVEFCRAALACSSCVLVEKLLAAVECS